MVCLGFEPGAAGWKAQTKPRSYGGHPTVLCLPIPSGNLSFTLKSYTARLSQLIPIQVQLLAIPASISGVRSNRCSKYFAATVKFLKVGIVIYHFLLILVFSLSSGRIRTHDCFQSIERSTFYHYATTVTKDPTGFNC